MSEHEASQPQTEGSRLRQELEAKLAEKSELQAELRAATFELAGFAPDSPQGKALDDLYDGAMEVEDVTAFASEIGLDPPQSSASPGSLDADDEHGVLSEGEQQRLAGEQRLQGLANGSLPTRSPTRQDEIAEAEADGDHGRANRLRAEQLERIRATGAHLGGAR